MATAANTNALQASANVWLPPPGVTGHAGEPIPPESNFFVPPPPEIGAVKSAHTSLKAGVKPKSQATRLKLVALWLGVGLVIGFLGRVLLGGLRRPEDLLSLSWVPVGAIFGVIFGFASWLMTRFKHNCSFVGTEGSVEIACKGTPENITTVKPFFFKGVVAVSTSVIHVHKSKRYVHTAFCYSWYPADSERASYEISGRHYAEAGNPPPGHPFNLARALENTWYAHLIPRADAELAQRGNITFYMGDNRWARLGRSFLEIVDKAGKVSRCESAEIALARLYNGMFTLTRKDSKSGFFGPTGVFVFEFGKMHNGRLFLIAFESLLGIKLV